MWPQKRICPGGDMARNKHLWIIAYDVSDNKARGKLARRLEDRAARVQGSVFEAWLTRAGATRLAAMLERYLDKGDSLRLYPVVNRSVPHCLAHGRGTAPSAGGHWVL